MTVQFKTTDTEVTIKTEWNTLHQFFNQDGKIRPLRSALALTKYNLYQRTSSLRAT
jgi:hypothetical protein